MKFNFNMPRAAQPQPKRQWTLHNRRKPGHYVTYNELETREAAKIVDGLLKQASVWELVSQEIVGPADSAIPQEHTLEVPVEEPSSDPVVEENPLECKTCGFLAKNPNGLKLHSRKHS